MLRNVDICSPEPFAAMVPAMPDESTCVVDTGSPYTSAAAMVAAESGRVEARTGLRMMPTFPQPSLSFRTAGFPRYGWKAGM